MLKLFHLAIAYSLVATLGTLNASSSPKQLKHVETKKIYPETIAGACDKTADWLARCNKASLTVSLKHDTKEKVTTIEKRDLMLAFMQAARAHNQHTYHSLKINPAELFATILPTLRKNNIHLLNMDPEERSALVNTLHIDDIIIKLATQTSAAQFCLKTATLDNGKYQKTEHSHI